jgi:hypothetical protein
MPDDAKFDWDELMKYRTAKPFRPFFIVFKDRREAEVLQPLWFGGAGDRLYVFHPRVDRRDEYKLSEIDSVRLMTVEELAERLPLLTRRGA